MISRQVGRRTKDGESSRVGLRQRSSEYAYRLLKRKILDSDYLPGEHVLEQDIAASSSSRVHPSGKLSCAWSRMVYW